MKNCLIFVIVNKVHELQIGQNSDCPKQIEDADGFMFIYYVLSTLIVTCLICLSQVHTGVDRSSGNGREDEGELEAFTP